MGFWGVFVFFNSTVKNSTRPPPKHLYTLRESVGRTHQAIHHSVIVAVTLNMISHTPSFEYREKHSLTSAKYSHNSWSS